MSKTKGGKYLTYQPPCLFTRQCWEVPYLHPILLYPQLLLLFSLCHCFTLFIRLICKQDGPRYEGEAWFRMQIHPIMEECDMVKCSKEQFMKWVVRKKRKTRESYQNCTQWPPHWALPLLPLLALPLLPPCSHPLFPLTLPISWPVAHSKWEKRWKNSKSQLITWEGAFAQYLKMAHSSL